jgi:CheY-like chemotaxis protein
VQRRALQLIVADCDRITASMDALVSLVRRNDPELRQSVDLNAVVRRILELQRYALSTAGIEVRTDLQEPLSRVRGETGALQQMVLELVIHAERSLAHRPDQRLLVVRTRESSQGVTLAVFDNGGGMSRDRLSRVFDAGAGGALGLSVAAGLVRDHAGSVRAESEEGRNTTLIVELPREGDTAVRRPRPAAAPEPAPDPSRPRSLRVLLADDEDSLRMAIRIYLERRGHQVTEAADAHAAWAAAQRAPFDVALVDARMPGDGVRLLEQLETLPALAGRTALMTGDLGRTRLENDVSTGRPCLAKPFEMNEMVRLLEALGA